jgi:hypothetical protein
VHTSLAELERLKALAPPDLGEKKVKGVGGLKGSTSLRNLLGAVGKSSSGRKSTEITGYFDVDDTSKASKKEVSAEKPKSISSSNRKIDAEGSIKKLDSRRQSMTKFEDVSIEIKCWVRKTWLAEFVQV